ncbi:NAD(P)-binding protein [uncultured Paraglaciecola sp.]|jgi:predicted NAD/FAD-dependent oxidoreductase|uniref:NAD(P)/FAD-dependent oxidoreductase n=1 Tax=uncultured Paraglaciecola sp. TaxID=1765024 RepID=UPI0025F870F0|nr:NAD(P)-binding protein [uncultured Paraglaciecola sp.]
MKIAVIGAGFTGCLLANFLDSPDIEVSIFEKSRGCGGRASTKQTDWGQCDLGASIVHAQKADFIDFMQGLCDQKLASKWPKNIFVSQHNTLTNQTLENFISEKVHYVFNSKMNAVCRHWIKNTKLYTNNLISQIRYVDDKGWQLKSNEVWHAEWFDKVVLTAPWPQTQVIIEQSELQMILPESSQSWTSCWSIGIKLEHPEKLDIPDIDLVYLKAQSIQMLIRDSAKPLRPLPLESTGHSEIWVAQLDNKLSDELGKQGKEKAVSVATEGICELFNIPEKSVSNIYAHYWGFAKPGDDQKSLGILSQQKRGLYVGGDWSFGASIESAFEAALTISHSIITDE